MASQSADFIVVGSGTGAIVTAATLRRASRSVIRIGDPLPHSQYMVGSGWNPEPPPAGFSPSPEPSRAILIGGKLMALPLSSVERVGLFGAEVAQASYALASARINAGIAAFVGGGREERSYRDWVVYRFGEPAYARLFAPYCEARFGPPADVIAGVARVVHGEVVAAGCGTPHGIWQDEPVTARVTGLSRDCVTTEAGTFTGRLVVDLWPGDVLGLWQPKEASLANEVARFEARDGLEVGLSGNLPVKEVHAVRAPFFRAVQSASGVVLHAALPHPPDDAITWALSAATDAGLQVSAEGAWSRLLPYHHAVWRTGHLTRLRAWTDALVDDGIEPVGRLGLAAPLSPAAIAAYAGDRLLTGASLRDCIRHHVEPPPRDGEHRPRLSAFVRR